MNPSPIAERNPPVPGRRALLAAAIAISSCATLARAAPASAEPGPIRIAQLVPSSGDLRLTGQELAAGARACAAWVNRSGGIRGRPLEIQLLPVGDDADSMADVTRSTMAQDDVAAVLTPTGRALNAALLPAAARQGVAVVGPYDAAALQISPEMSTAYFLRSHPVVEALRLVDQIQSMGLGPIAIVYADDPVGRETLPVFEEALASLGLTPATVLALAPGGAGDAVARALVTSGARSVMLATRGRQTVRALQMLEGPMLSGHRMLPVALSTAASQEELRSAGAAARRLIVSQVVPSPFSSASALTRFYAAALRASNGGEPSYPGLEGCVAVLTFARVLASSSEAPNRAGILRAFRTARDVDLGGWSVDLSDRKRPGSRFTDLVQISSDGRWVR